jgi:enoyl-CoA hydratase/carnithine racemase
MDLEMIRYGTGLDLRRYLEKLYFEMHDLQYRMGKPTIAALPGPARAAGVTLAVSCDVIVASETASIAYPEILVGVIPAMHFVHLPRQIGRHKAFELLFSGQPISAQEAYDRGLLNHLVPQGEVMTKARELAADFAAKSPLVMQLARDSFMRANDFEYRRAIENVVETICNIIELDDAKEGLNAFNEKRPPRW